MPYEIEVISVQGIVAALHVLKNDKAIASYCKADLIGKVVKGSCYDITLEKEEFQGTIAEFKRKCKLVKCEKHQVRISF